MAHGPWREFLIGVVASMEVVLGVYYGFGLGEHSSSSLLYKEERQEQSVMEATPPAPGTYRAGASASSSRCVFSPQQSTTEKRKRQTDTEAYITARLGELGQIGTQETELGQFTPSLLDALSIE
jgi:hypothetical protein